MRHQTVASNKVVKIASEVVILCSASIFDRLLPGGDNTKDIQPRPSP